jgi:hypothetical protein
MDSNLQVGAGLSKQGLAIVRAFVKATTNGDVSTASREAAIAADACPDEAQRIRTLISVIGDLLAHGWKFSNAEGAITARLPLAVPLSSKKEGVRQVQLAQRERQLLKPSIREFVRKMEKRRLGPTGWCSIYSLVRDGLQLADRLKEALGAGTEIVPNVISPYIQVVENAEQRCEFTGLRLMDVWRYFRYTWAMPYNSVPGRSMLLLVRDSAAQNHPVIGIAGLGSAVVQLGVRDKWIGWTSDAVIERLRDKPTKKDASWIATRYADLLNGIYKADLISGRLLSRAELKSPTEKTIKKLRHAASNSWADHHRFPSKSDHKSRAYSARHWARQARLPLFKAKRCETLARLLEVQKAFRESTFTKTADGLRELVSNTSGRRAIEIILRSAKAQHVGIDMLDITICGAVPPYNPLIGGKLVAMLLCSPEVRAAYEKRYSGTPSVIASSMAGRAVRRRPRLVFLGTTSLYGERLNQYHRIKLPATELGGTAGVVSYEFLGESLGFGSSHLSSDTVAEIERLLSHLQNGRKVNSIFGEGVSPRLRKIRDGLDALGFVSDVVLKHGNRRLIYGIALANNFRQILIGAAENPDYILPQRGKGNLSMLIAKYWGRRWLRPRLERRPDVIELVATLDINNTYTHPARVVLPESIEDTAPLFA